MRLFLANEGLNLIVESNKMSGFDANVWLLPQELFPERNGDAFIPGSVVRILSNQMIAQLRPTEGATLYPIKSKLIKRLEV